MNNTPNGSAGFAASGGSADSRRVEHRLIHGAECCYGNSGHSFETGFDFFYCTCGKWRGEYQGERAAAIAHQTHALQQPPNDQAEAPGH